ncbi:hypothetical protein [Hyphomicrobium sp. NDB2Meth4]|uniref:hypothetical protein n=1 Tax=Hyphomicrobium sp. NDB2Meth4 TaxID=1892846 RepID=UPI000A52D36B|nr:hypothetical protein [Hyphomicrobium sp. NDB2Meth4]
MGWLTTSIINDADVIEMMSKAIKAAGHFEEAETFKRRMNKFLGSKEGMVKCLARFMKIPDESVVMRYFDVHSQSFKDVKVTAKY